jgi:hypothetical protein
VQVVSLVSMPVAMPAFHDCHTKHASAPTRLQPSASVGTSHFTRCLLAMASSGRHELQVLSRSTSGAGLAARGVGSPTVGDGPGYRQLWAQVRVRCSFQWQTGTAVFCRGVASEAACVLDNSSLLTGDCTPGLLICNSRHTPAHSQPICSSEGSRDTPLANAPLPGAQVTGMQGGDGPAAGEETTVEDLLRVVKQLPPDAEAAPVRSPSRAYGSGCKALVLTTCSLVFVGHAAAHVLCRRGFGAPVCCTNGAWPW